MRALRHVSERGDLNALIAGSALTLAAVVATMHVGVKVGAGSLALVAFFCAVVAGWLLAPHIVVALTIPLFAAIPITKVLVASWVGPIKDVVVLAALVATLFVALQRGTREGASPVDRLLIGFVLALFGLYIVNVGGAISGGSHGIAWAQGVRLVGEPLILFAAGLTLANPRRTLSFAVASLIATGVAVASYGILQQYLGEWRLVAFGYSFREQVRTIGGRLRSFGTLDQPFDYAALLLLALSAVLFWMRRGPLKGTIIAVLATGLAFSFVRGALVTSVALLAILLVSWGRVTIGLLLLAASTVTALAFLLALSGAHETHSVRSGPNTYITLNGRTTVWETIFSKPSQVPFGAGVGKFGTAAERAQFGVTADPAKAQKKARAVDSGYFATVADVGLIGLVVLVLMFTRIAVLARAATRRTGRIGWLVIGWLAVLLIDAVFRASFTGFPTAFLGMLLIGIGIAASSTPPVASSRR
jgi:hypothetical protein